MSFLLVQTVTLDIQPSSCFGSVLYEANNLNHLPQTLQSVLTPCRTLLISVALLTLRVRTRLGCLLVRFSTWPPNQTSWLTWRLSGDTNRQLWKKVCEFSQLGALNSTDLAYLLLDSKVPKM